MSRTRSFLRCFSLFAIGSPYGARNRERILLLDQKFSLFSSTFYSNTRFAFTIFACQHLFPRLNVPRSMYVCILDAALRNSSTPTCPYVSNEIQSREIPFVHGFERGCPFWRVVLHSCEGSLSNCILKRCLQFLGKSNTQAFTGIQNLWVP